MKDSIVFNATIVTTKTEGGAVDVDKNLNVSMQFDLSEFSGPVEGKVAMLARRFADYVYDEWKRIHGEEVSPGGYQIGFDLGKGDSTTVVKRIVCEDCNGAGFTYPWIPTVDGVPRRCPTCGGEGLLVK